MGRMFVWTWLVAASLLLCGCYTHNLPMPDQQFIHVDADVPTARIFVDADGTFYPQHWRPPGLGPFGVWSANSLLGEAERRPNLGPLLRSERLRQMSEMRAFLAGKKRIFVFIHGFDNNQADTVEPYTMLARRIDFEPGDAIILFHWDGFDAHIYGAQLNFWRMAANNSQMAGSRGLRPVLDLAGPEQQVFLVSHSRGASVALSALSNPRYSRGFAARTRALPYARAEHLLDPPPLAAGPRNVHAVMMGPAIGRIDFLVPDCAPMSSQGRRGRCDNVREFPRLASIDYTVNPCDEVLDKYLGFSGIFTPTNLGLVPEIGQRLAPALAGQGIAMRAHRTTPPHNHIFPLYAADPQFTEMMAALGVATHAWPTPAAAETCHRSRRQAQAAGRMGTVPVFQMRPASGLEGSA